MQLMPNHPTELLSSFVAELTSTASLVPLDQKTEVAFVEGPKSARLDARLLMRLPIGDEIEIAVEVMRTAYPRDVRLAMQQLLSYKEVRQGSSSDLVLCVVADYISPGSRDLLKEAGICYYDSTGSMYFVHHTYLIVKESGPKRRQSRRASQVFSGAREQVVHALLVHWQQAHFPEDAYISGAELADLAQTSTYTVSLTMQALEREDLVESSGRGPYQRRRLSNAAGLLDAWAAEWVSRNEEVTRWYAYSPRSNPMDMVMASFNGHHGWAVTGAAAANIVAPYLTAVERVQVIVPPGCGVPWGKEMDFKQVDKGANIVMVEREGASLMFRDEHPDKPGSRFASRFIQYLDLLDGYGRNKELAEEFRHQVLKM